MTKREQIKEFVKHAKLATCCTSLLLIILGVFLLINPSEAIMTVCRIVGCIMVVAGVVLIILFIVRKRCEVENNVNYILIILGVILFALGIFVVLKPGVIVGFVSILFAVILFLQAAAGIRGLTEQVKYKDGKWWIGLLIVVVTVLMALLVLIQPLFLASILMRITGVFMILSGIGGLFMNFRIMHYGKQYRKEHPEYVEEMRKKAYRDRVIDVDAEEEEIPPIGSLPGRGGAFEDDL